MVPVTIRVLVVLCVLSSMVIFMPSASAGTIAVACGDTAGLATAIANANDEAASPGLDTIVLAAGCTYVVTTVAYADVDLSDTGLPVIDSEITITGNGATIARDQSASTPAFRLFRVSEMGTLELQNVTISGGSVPGGPGGAVYSEGVVHIVASSLTGNTAELGGAIMNSWGYLDITDSTLTANTAHNGGAIGFEGSDGSDGYVSLLRTAVSQNLADRQGGGIHNIGGHVELTDSRVERNHTDESNGGGISVIGGHLVMVRTSVSFNGSGWHGGGISTYDDYKTGRVDATDSVIQGNFAYLWGGGILGGEIKLDRTTVASNESAIGSGGGIACGHLVATNSTFYQNSTNDDPGGALACSQAIIDHSAFVANRSGWEGGVFADGTYRVSNSIMAFNHSYWGGNCWASVVDGGGNISFGNTATESDYEGIEDYPCPGLSVDPTLGTYGQYGGPTPMLALQPGSPAIDAAIGCADVDQRGEARPTDGNGDGVAACDIGPYEAPAVPPTGYPAEIVTDGPSGYWRMSETSGTAITDRSGNGNHGTTKGSVVLGAPGVLLDSTDPAVRFDSGGDYITVPDSVSLSPTRLTVETWVKLDAYTGFYPYIVNKPNGFYLNVSDGTDALAGTLFFRVYTPTSKTISTSSADALQLGRWYHIVGTYDGTALRLYIDGVQRASLNATGSVADTTSALTFGTSGRLLSGSLDEVAIYDHALTPERILAHYTASGRTAPVGYNLSVTKNGTGNGTVTSSPAGITCGIDCSESYLDQTQVLLTSTATSGSTFTGWGGACSGTTPTCTVTMDQAAEAIATFTLQTPLTLTVVKAGTGRGTISSSPSGIGCGIACSKTFNTVTTVTLKATPATGSSFNGWSGGCVGTALTCTVTVNQAVTVTATFTDPSRPVRITGKVLHQGHGLSNIAVNIVCKPVSGTSCLAVMDSKTLGDGSFVIHGTPGTYDLYIVQDFGTGSREPTRVVATTAGTYADVAVNTEPGSPVSGIVTDAVTGAPLGGVKLTITIPLQSPNKTATMATTTTNADGRYQLALIPRTYTIKLTKTGYKGKTLSMTVTGPTTGQNYTLQQ